jgi:hypothetical protein
MLVLAEIGKASPPNPPNFNPEHVIDFVNSTGKRRARFLIFLANQLRRAIIPPL